MHASCGESGLIFHILICQWVSLHFHSSDPPSSMLSLSWPLQIDTQRSQMTRGLRDNPGRLIITPSAQWRKPDLKHGTERPGEPSAWADKWATAIVAPLVCVFWKESGQHTFKVLLLGHNCTNTKTLGPHVEKEFEDNYVFLQHHRKSFQHPSSHYTISITDADQT